MLVEYIVRLGLLLLTPQLLDLGSHLGQLGAVQLLLVGNLALIFSTVGIVAASEGVCLAGFCLELSLQVVGLFLLARLLLLQLRTSAEPFVFGHVCPAHLLDA